jgi:hypothetical protein
MHHRKYFVRGISLLGTALLFACGPSEIKLDDLGVTVTAPAGWSVEMARASSIGAGGAELKKGKKTYGFIDPKVVIPLGADDKAWPETGAHTLEHLKATLAPFSPTDPQTFSNGFGVRYQQDGKPKFLYVITLGEKEYSCWPNDWIPAEDVPDAISICTSVRS